MRNAVDLVAMSGEPMTVHNLYRVVLGAAQTSEEVHSEAWRSKSFCFQCLKAADERGKSPRDEQDFELVADYFCVEFPQLSDKTRSVIVSTFTSTIDVLNRGLLRELLCTSTTISPDVVEQGKILLIDLPVKEFGVAGKLCQVIFKYCFQRAIERRNVETSPRPVFLYADEAQNFLSDYDHQFLATCRSARVATVLLTQNLAGLEAALGGHSHGESAARSLVGHLNTRIFHANSDPHTNEWAANLVGKDRLLLTSGNQSRPNDFSMTAAFGLGRPGESSTGFSESIDYRLQPAEFSQLRTGGPANRGMIDAIVFQNGRAFPSTGLPFAHVTFEQPSS
jgi:type IV secretory pathway TraG/TraD family ATPase VirD4